MAYCKARCKVPIIWLRLWWLNGYGHEPTPFNQNFWVHIFLPQYRWNRKSSRSWEETFFGFPTNLNLLSCVRLILARCNDHRPHWDAWKITKIIMINGIIACPHYMPSSQGKFNFGRISFILFVLRIFVQDILSSEVKGSSGVFIGILISDGSFSQP